jgi:cytochrome c oxidase cbb3-type subunit 4
MTFDYESLVAFSKSWGLFYLIALGIGVVIYTFRPSNKARFDKAKNDILDDEL